MKRLCSIILTVIMLVSVFPSSVYASNSAPSYQYELAADGQTEKYVRSGDVITVTLYLNRTDANEAYTMYAMQDEIRYDSSFFEYVEGSELLASGVRTTKLDVGGGYKEVYLNFLSFGGGEKWQARKPIGSFQFRVIAETGVSKITHQDYLVSLQDGSGSYPCETNELTIILSTDCTVRLETNGGTDMDSITAIYGERLAKPTEPKREGKVFAGWYKNIDCTEEWSFDVDTVSGNITLYAKWNDMPVLDNKPEQELPPNTDNSEAQAPPKADNSEIKEPSETDKPQDEFESDGRQTEKSGNKLWLLWLILALVLLIGLCVFLFVWIRKKNTDNTTPSPEPQEAEEPLPVEEIADKPNVEPVITGAVIKTPVQGKKFTVNIDQLSLCFESGDIVNLAALKEKGLVPKNVSAIKILARGVLDKKLIVEANDFSDEAIRKIEACQGTAIKI